MRGVIIIGTILAFAPALLAESALDAIKLLPGAQSARIARIEGREGAPEPERWYILTQDPTADNGVHEFVVSNGQIVASRSLSQFADNLKPEDMLGGLPVIDSDKAAKVARDFATANGDIVATLSYDLKKDATTGTPVWTISCIDDKGAKLGCVVMTAGKGDVVSHDGFPLEPAPPPTPRPIPLAVAADSHLADHTDVEPVHHYHHLSPSPSPKPAGVVSKTLNTVGHTLQKLLPF